MGKLEDKFEKILDSTRDTYGGMFSDDSVIVGDAKKLCAKEAKDIAIEFAKYMFKKKIHVARSMNDVEEYWPHEFQIILGELIKDTDGNNFNDFIEEQYGQ